LSGAAPAVNPLPAYLADRGVDAELVAPGADMPTVEKAAAALGVAPAAVVKSIVFQHKRDRTRACLAVVPGDRQAERRKVAAALGLSQLKLASPDVTLEATGYPVGGVAPVGHRTPLPVVVDRRVLDHAEVWGGGGDERHMLRIAPRLVVELTGATVADVVADVVNDAADGT
jgi:Cys-tRNA(Pro) deacylase